jgi:hypothetical protein
MRARAIDDAEEMLRVLQDEIRRSEEARYDHRLHGVLLVAQGMSAQTDSVVSASAFSAPGDAGALVIVEDGTILGLLIGEKSDRYHVSLVCTIEPVLEKYGCELLTG